jgi:transposase
MHVAKIERRHQGRVYCSYLLRRSVRDGTRVKHQTLGNLSHLPAHAIDVIRRVLKGESVGFANSDFKVLRTRPHGHVAAALGVLRSLELDRIIASRRSRERDLVTAMIVARIIDPRSKLATAQGLQEETLESTLGEILELGTANEDELYAAMDWLLARQAKIENVLAQRHLRDGSLVLCDVTSTWFEGRTCPLAKLGHSRDGKKHKPQIVFGLLCDNEGCPVAVEVFEGNTADPKTLATQIRKLKDRFKLKRVVLIGDRGLITDARIRDDFGQDGDMDWVTALRAPAIRNLLDQGAIDRSLFDERDMAEVKSPDYPGERLIVCRNPLLAEERARKREDLLQATARDLEKIRIATQRAKRPLRSREKIALRVGKTIGRHKMGKHFEITISDDGFTFGRNEASIESEKRLDGFYVIRTSLAAKQMPAKDAVRAYKSLSGVERAFRSHKTIDLKVRPIHHRLADRVKAHVFLCMLAYYVEWNMRKLLAPVLFDDEDRPEQDSPVKPAERSEAAKRKAQARRTPDGLPVESLQGVLRNLRTIAKNRIRIEGDEAKEFDMTTQPTEHQTRILELLGVGASL